MLQLPVSDNAMCVTAYLDLEDLDIDLLDLDLLLEVDLDLKQQKKKKHSSTEFTSKNPSILPMSNFHETNCSNPILNKNCIHTTLNDEKLLLPIKWCIPRSWWWIRSWPWPRSGVTGIAERLSRRSRWESRISRPAIFFLLKRFNYCFFI